ncbi:hypothetical protein AB3S75_025367 [Citrus x aurantiifolia]
MRKSSFHKITEDGDKAGRKPLPYLGILPVSFLVDFHLPEAYVAAVSCAHEQRVHSVKLPYCVTVHFTYRQAQGRQVSWVRLTALLHLVCVSVKLRCWKISRTVWIYQDWTLLICICTYS